MGRIAAEGARRRERPSEETVGQGHALRCGTEEHRFKKIVTPAARRTAVAHAREGRIVGDYSSGAGERSEQPSRQEAKLKSPGFPEISRLQAAPETRTSLDRDLAAEGITPRHRPLAMDNPPRCPGPDLPILVSKDP